LLTSRSFFLADAGRSQVIDFPDLDKVFRTNVVRLLVSVSKKFGRYPECLSISGLQLPGKYPVACGAYGDVWKGLLRGEDVSVKVVRVSDRSVIESLLKVSKQWLAIPVCSLLVGFLSRSDHLEPVFPSECLAILWHILFRPTDLPCLALDVEWKSHRCLTSTTTRLE
jgi:hypothetical protein